MTISWEQEPDNLLVIRIKGKLNFPELINCQSDIEPIIQSTGKVDYLVMLEDFAGWDSDEGWADIGFAEENDEYISRFAFVGEEAWRDEIMLFMMAGLRRIDIRYFTSEEAARDWLAGS